jgi:hypothetical protein
MLSEVIAGGVARSPPGPSPFCTNELDCYCEADIDCGSSAGAGLRAVTCAAVLLLLGWHLTRCACLARPGRQGLSGYRCNEPAGETAAAAASRLAPHKACMPCPTN